MRRFLILAAVVAMMPLGCSSGPKDLPPESVQVGDIHKKEVEQELRERERERQRKAMEGEGTSDSE
jgi:hypothetical protein